MKTYNNQSQWDCATQEDEKYIEEYDEDRISELWEFAESKYGDSTQVFVKYLKHVFDEGIMESYDLLQKTLSNEAIKSSTSGTYLRSPLAMLMNQAFEWEARNDKKNS